MRHVIEFEVEQIAYKFPKRRCLILYSNMKKAHADYKYMMDQVECPAELYAIPSYSAVAAAVKKEFYMKNIHEEGGRTWSISIVQRPVF